MNELKKTNPLQNPKPRPKVKGPKRITASYLENAAVFYLQRYDSTGENLRRVLRRKVKRAAAHPEADIDMLSVDGWIDGVITKMQRIGYIDDTRTASTKARTLFARGIAPGMIRRRLNAAGAPEEAIDTALATLQENNEGNLNLQAAATFARRRRLGPHRPQNDREAKRDKDLAALARAGFGYAIAHKIINAETPEDILDDI